MLGRIYSYAHAMMAEIYQDLNHGPKSQDESAGGCRRGQREAEGNGEGSIGQGIHLNGECFCPKARFDHEARAAASSTAEAEISANAGSRRRC